MTPRRVLITCPQMQRHAGDFAEVFAAHGIDAEVPPVVQQLSEEELAEMIDRYEGVIAGDDPFTARVLGRAGRLRVISKWGVGIDNIDLEAARARGIRVTNTPGTFGDEVADVVVGYLVLLTRRLHTTDSLVRAGQWPKIEGISLAGRTLGIVGLGSIGLALARRTQAMGMSVVGFDVSSAQRRLAPGLGIEAVSLEELLRRADFVSLNCPLTAENRHVIGDAEFRLMREGAYLINTARGPLVDETALADALREGRLAGAALDVFEEEPLPNSSPLRTFENVILGAHNGSNSGDAVRRVNELAVRNLIDGLTAQG